MAEEEEAMHIDYRRKELKEKQTQEKERERETKVNFRRVP